MSSLLLLSRISPMTTTSSMLIWLFSCLSGVAVMVENMLLRKRILALMTNHNRLLYTYTLKCDVASNAAFADYTFFLAWASQPVPDEERTRWESTKRGARIFQDWPQFSIGQRDCDTIGNSNQETCRTVQEWSALRCANQQHLFSR